MSAELHHWHPVLFSRELGKKPRCVTLAGQRLVIFRTKSGKLGALDDACPHRRMALSAGQVQGEEIVCAWHGWRFDVDGVGRCPAVRSHSPRARAYDVAEFEGMLWLRRTDSDRPLPIMNHDGLVFVARFRRLVPVPMELALDANNEVEHTGRSHRYFGYELTELDKIEQRIEVDAEHLAVRSRGPQKALPWFFRSLSGVRLSDRFISDWQVHFSPVHGQYDHSWVDTQTDSAREFWLRSWIFFVPVEAESTMVWVVTYARLPRGGRLLKALSSVVGQHALWEDGRVLARLADKRVGLAGMQLTRLDTPLRESRRLIQTIYRGSGPSLRERTAQEDRHCSEIDDEPADVAQDGDKPIHRTSID